MTWTELRHRPPRSFDLVPTVSISALTVAKVNPSDRLVLVGELGPTPFDFDYEWTYRGQLVSGTLEEGTTTSTTGRIAAGVQALRYLVVPPGLLTAGTLYKFTLSATRTFDSALSGGAAIESGSSLITVEVNSPPSSGTFSVQPSQGVVLETRFYFESLG